MEHVKLFNGRKNCSMSYEYYSGAKPLQFYEYYSGAKRLQFA